MQQSATATLTKPRKPEHSQEWNLYQTLHNSHCLPARRAYTASLPSQSFSLLWCWRSVFVAPALQPISEKEKTGNSGRTLEMSDSLFLLRIKKITRCRRQHFSVKRQLIILCMSFKMYNIGKYEYCVSAVENKTEIRGCCQLYIYPFQTRLGIRCDEF